MGIEPTYPAWKAGVLPLNYTRRLFIFSCLLKTKVIILYKIRIVNTFLKKNLKHENLRGKTENENDGSRDLYFDPVSVSFA